MMPLTIGAAKLVPWLVLYWLPKREPLSPTSVRLVLSILLPGADTKMDAPGLLNGLLPSCSVPKSLGALTEPTVMTARLAVSALVLVLAPVARSLPPAMTMAVPRPPRPFRTASEMPFSNSPTGTTLSKKLLFAPQLLFTTS